jgi:recombinational DNA repair protein (RecF pathway)
MHTCKKTVNICCRCSRNLSETEVYFYGSNCSECVYQNILKFLNKKRGNKNG